MPFLKIKYHDAVFAIRQKVELVSKRLIFFTSLLAVGLVVVNLGISFSPTIKLLISKSFDFFIPSFLVLILLRFLAKDKKSLKTRFVFQQLLQVVLLTAIVIVRTITSAGSSIESSALLMLSSSAVSYIASAIVFTAELSNRDFTVFNPSINPATIFVLSFLGLIMLGTAFLLLPKATTGHISFIDALFTATSAVCVTGLIVVDTATAFTILGKGIILVLIQLGGLGIMTFTTFFSIFFRGNTSFQSQLYMKDMVNETNISDVLKTILKIVLFTFIVEAIGAYVIFFTLEGEFLYKLKTSIFHSISGFCNAGFSTFTNGLMEGNLKTNYPLHLIIAILVIFGGLGFPVIFNFYLLIKHRIKNAIKSIFARRWKNQHQPHIINASSRLVIITTSSLLAVGFLLFLVTEWSGTLAAQPWYGKLVTAFFGSVTPRTAGFNTVDYSSLGHATILFTLVLMWIGASPGSTGGGIKTSTFAVAILNLLSVVRGKQHTEFLNVEISSTTMRRAFSIITLSIFVIGSSTFLIKVFNPDIELLPIMFESISAFSTVGLSMGITSSLSTGSKVVITLTMFIGRVGMLNILVGILKQVAYNNYRYPSENILIN